MTQLSNIRIQSSYFKFRRYFSQCSCLMNLKNPSTPDSKSVYPIKKLLSQKIKATGPITIADFMKDILINPAHGYYTTKDVFGQSGDFITSPEISQMFGELIAVWFIDEWMKVGSPKPFHIIELGPGRGTMMSDILRTFHRLKIGKHVTVHMIEVSEVLANIQVQKLNVFVEESSSEDIYYKKGRTNNDVPIFWYKNFLDAKIEGFTLLVAQEFFDALPIHKFQNTLKGWREVMIDIDQDNNFKYVLSPGPTPMTKILISENEIRDELEICPDSLAIMQIMADRMEKYGGISLIVDYGHDGTKTDTFRAFSKHTQCDPLSNVGNADLTADVDFAALKRVVSDKLISYGPVAQKQFLNQLYIDVRLEALMRTATKQQRESLLSGYHMLMDDDQMGTRFQVVAFFPAVLKNLLQKYPPVGFIDNFVVNKLSKS